MKKKILELMLTALAVLLIFGTSRAQDSTKASIVNPSHLDYLYKNIKVNGCEMGIVHIYADYPDYEYVGAKGEGIACVDDAARAGIFYINYYKDVPSAEIITKVKNIANFMLYMQARNGFFYNFIWKDYSIDSTYKTSVAEPNWWSWRAIWFLTEAHNFLLKHDSTFAASLEAPITRAVNSTSEWLLKYFDKTTVVYGGMTLPDFLPYNNAADQAAILVLGFTNYYKYAPSEKIENIIEKLCEGITYMQAGSESQPPYCAFLSWRNSWHEWGNSQAYALMKAARVFHKPQFVWSAIKEVKYFYPFLIQQKYLNEFNVEKVKASYKMTDEKPFAQIAYGIRPMVWAALYAYRITKDKTYAETAAELACWLLGKNVAGIQMYHPESGVCYDGIISPTEVNKNSGAESTIEALLTMQEIEQFPAAEKIVREYYKKNK